MVAKVRMVLLEAGSAKEVRSVLHAAMLEDTEVVRLCAERLFEHSQALRSGEAVPVGCVEFVREAMRCGGILEPSPLSYPAPLLPLLHRWVERSRVGLLSGRCFVKPVNTKRFTGFVYDEAVPDEMYSEHDREQLRALRSLPAHEPIWRGEVVHFLSEWRYYVKDAEILGRSRYDPDGEDAAPQPDLAVVERAVAAMRQSRVSAYALDMGVNERGQTVLVEVNDAWALGLYGRALEPSAYWDLLRTRWMQLHERSWQRVGPVLVGTQFQRRQNDNV